MKKINLNKKNKIKLSIVLVIVFILYRIIFGGSNEEVEIKSDSPKIVETLSLINQTSSGNIELTGTTKAIEGIDISIETSGKIKSISKKEGSLVKKGEVIMTLENTEEILNYRRAETDLENERINLDNMVSEANGDSSSLQSSLVLQQERAVENARIALLSNSLEAIPQSRTSTLVPPTITGSYSGPIGQYKLEIERKSNYIYVETFGIEKTDTEKLLENKSTKLGTHGLYIQFPGDISDYVNTIWYIDLPNTKSTSYASFDNAYRTALNTRDVTLRQSEVTNNDLASQRNLVEQKEISLQQANLLLEKTILRAPFDGELISFNHSVGETITANTTLGSVKNLDQIEIEFFISSQDKNVIKKDTPILLNGDIIGNVYFVGSAFATNEVKIRAKAILNDEYSKNIVVGSDISFTISTDGINQVQLSESGKVLIPLTSLQIIGSDPNITTVEDGVIKLYPVSTGLLLGDNIEILDGLSNINSIVIDARGLKEGEVVKIKS
jgi:multidrug efflux pump subunit AcrA (membrane-fusion protein)